MSASKQASSVFTAVGCTVQGEADKDAVVAHCLEEFKAKVGGMLDWSTAVADAATAA